MFLPVGDAPNPRGYTPWVNWTLIVLNVAVYVWLVPRSWQAPDPSDPVLREYVQTLVAEHPEAARDLRSLVASLSRYDLFVFEHGFRPAQPRALEIMWSMFLHGGLMHLLGNMLFLWIFGDNLEHRLGRWRYLLFYLGTGVAAVFGDALLRMGSGIPAVGASGAISGVLGAYFLWFPHNRVRTWILLFPFWVDRLEIRARWVLGFYVVVQNLLPLLLSGGAGGISHGAHLGGFFAGLGVAWALDRYVLERPERDLFEEFPRGRAWTEELVAFRSAVRAGRLHEAAARLLRLPRRVAATQVPPAEIVWVGRGLEADGHSRAALAAYEIVLRSHGDRPEAAQAHLGCARILLQALHLPTDAYQHLRGAFELAHDPRDIAEARALWEELTRRSLEMPRGPGRAAR